MTTPAFGEMDVAALVREVQRYLAAVDTFRAEGHEPHWSPERTDAPAQRTRHRLVRRSTGAGTLTGRLDRD